MMATLDSRSVNVSGFCLLVYVLSYPVRWHGIIPLSILLAGLQWTGMCYVRVGGIFVTIRSPRHDATAQLNYNGS